MRGSAAFGNTFVENGQPAHRVEGSRGRQVSWEVLQGGRGEGRR